MRRSDQRRAAVFVIYQRDVTDKPLEELFEEARADHELGATEFTRELVAGVDAERRELDELIATHAVDWSLERIAPLERAILRVALYEMLFREDIPVEVAIDEAVELAKRYCGADAPAFINGILGTVARRQQADTGAEWP